MSIVKKRKLNVEEDFITFLPLDLALIVIDYTKSLYKTLLYNYRFEILDNDKWIPMEKTLGTMQFGFELWNVPMVYKNFLYSPGKHTKNLLRFNFQTSCVDTFENVFSRREKDYTEYIMDSEHHCIIRLKFNSRHYQVLDLNTLLETNYQYSNQQELECNSNSWSFTMHMGKIYIFEYQTWTILDLQSHTLAKTSNKSNLQFFNPGLLSLGTKLYVMGGRSWTYYSQVCHNKVEVYDSEKDSWQICDWRLPASGTYSTYHCKSENKVFICGLGKGMHWFMNINNIGKWITLPSTEYHQAHIVNLQEFL